ncbi:MAG TPA: hypothetical protein DDX01_08100 [Holosporales bacterium]|nr:hypothetical protein [Holosporales bacterium]
MLVVHNQVGIRCIAWETLKADGPFHCLECLGEVILKKGPKKEHHYAHKPPVNCEYGATESQLHLHAKREIYNALLNSDCLYPVRTSITQPEELSRMSAVTAGFWQMKSRR